MSINFSPESQRFVESTIAQGTFASEHEAVNAALDALRERDELRQQLAEAMASESISAEVVFEHLRQRANEIASRAQ
jgi:putative addiction module CopG family antidote